MLPESSNKERLTDLIVPMLSYATYWQPLLRLNDTFITKIRQYADDMGMLNLTISRNHQLT